MNDRNQSIRSVRLDRVARVFVSSTFQDMQPERDELSFRVFPELRARCRERGISLIDVDLRWGITEEQEIRGEVLPLCLAQIDESRPFFLGLLGQRYGSVMPRFDQALINEYPWLEDHRDKSLTEIEFLHGCLLNPRLDGHQFFYFRSPEYVARLPEDQRHAFVEENVDRSQRLETLKQAVRNAKLPVLEGYEDCRMLGDKILEDLWSAICSIPEWEAPASSIVRLSGPTFDFLEFHVERDEEPALNDHVSGNHGGLVLTGPAGAGKSAMLAAWVRKFRVRQPDVQLFEYYEDDFAGRGVSTRRLTDKLAEWLGTRLPNDLEATGDIIDNRANEYIASALEEAAVQRPVVLILDGLNRIDNDAMSMALSFIPSPLPENLSIICSARPGQLLDIARQRGWAELEIGPLSKDQVDQLIQRYFERWGKRLDKARRRRLARHPLAGIPLFLRAMLEQLRVGTLHGELDDHIAQLCSLEEPSTLFRWILKRIEHRLDPDNRPVLHTAMRLLYVSRNGLMETELLTFLIRDVSTDAQRVWSTIYLALQESLTFMSGRIAFRHDHIREAARSVFLDSDDQTQHARSTLIDYFRQATDSPRKLEELPWLLREAGELEELRDCIATPEVFCGLWDQGLLSDLFEYWSILAPSFQMERALEATLDSFEPGDSAARSRAKYARIAGLFFGQLKQHKPAVYFFERAIEYLSEVQHWDSGPVAGTSLSLSLTYLEWQKFELAIATARRALALHHRIYGVEHPRTAEALNCLAMSLAQAGHASAKAVFERALELTVKHRGQNHAGVSVILDNMATYLPNDPLAVKRHREALAISENSTGPESVETAKCLDNLAKALLGQREFEEAHALAGRALTIWERERGPAHADTLVCLTILFLSSLGKRDFLSAARHYRRTLDAMNSEPPDEPNKVRERVLSLNQHLFWRGQFAESEKLLRSYVRLADRHFDEVNCDVQIALANTCREIGALDEAKALFQTALSPERHTVLADSQNRSRALIGLSKVLRDEQRLDESVKCLEEGLSIIRLLDEADPHGETECYSQLAQTAVEMNNLESAERWSALAIDSAANLAESDSANVGVMLDLRARILLAQNKLDEAEDASRKAVAKLEELLSLESVHTLSALHNLGTIRHKQGDLNEAEEVLRRVVERRERIMGPAHRSTRNSQEHLALVLRDKGDYEASLETLQHTDAQSGTASDSDNYVRGRHLVIARNLLNTEKHKEAERAFRELLASCDLERTDDTQLAFACYVGLGQSLESLEKLDKAADAFRRAIDLVSSVDDAGPADQIRTIGDLARTLNKQRKYEEAEALVRRCICIAREANIDALQIAALEFQLAQSITLQGDHQRALPLYQQCVRALESETNVDEDLRDRFVAALDVCHRRCEAGTGARISSLLDRGEGCLMNSGIDEAEAPIREAASLAKSDPDIPVGLLGRSLSALSALQRARGQLIEAEATCRESLELDDRTTAEGVNNAVTGYSNLAFLLQEQNKLEEAAHALRTVVDLMGRTEGVFDNRRTTSTVERLATCLIAIGEEEEAAELLANTIEANAELFRQGESEAVAIFFVLAKSFRDRFSVVVADALVSKVHELVPRDSQIWPLLGGYSSHLHAHICAQDGRIEEAIHHFESVLDAMGDLIQPEILDSDRELPGQIDWAVRAALYLAEHRDQAQERWDRALSNFRLAAKLQARLGQHGAALDTELKIHLMRDAAGRPIDLHRVRELAAPLEKWIAENPDTEPVNRAIGFNNLSLAFRKLGALEEAEALSRKALEIDEQFRSADHPKIAHRLNNLSLILICLERFEEASHCVNRAWQIQQGRNDAILVRTLVTQVLIQMLSGLPIGETINQLKLILLAPDGFSDEYEFGIWDISDVIDRVESGPGSSDASLVAALANAFNDRNKLEKLDEFEAWCDPSTGP